MLCYWDWTLLTAVPANFLAITLNVTFNTYLQTALNLALLGGQGTSGSLIDAGAQLGTMNGQPLLAGNRLNIAPGGNLSVHVGSGQWIGNAEVQGTLSVGNLTGGMNNNITATPGASQTGAALLSGLINRVTTVVTATDSTILPPLTIAPVGSIIIVHNAAAANSMGVWPDVGSQINVLGANIVLPVAINKPVVFIRVGTLNWTAIVSA
jgi:hypothetical protein